MTTANNQKKKIRYAVLGIGWIAQEDVLPAFANTENSQLVALFSEDPAKREELSKQYGFYFSGSRNKRRFADGSSLLLFRRTEATNHY